MYYVAFLHSCELSNIQQGPIFRLINFYWTHFYRFGYSRKECVAVNVC